MLAALAIGFFVFRAITRPIDQLTRAAHQLAQGDLSARVAVDDHPARLGSDEISELGTAFNSMADHLQQSEQVRRDMTADIAHELRTPLAVMRGNLEAMQDGVYPLDVEHLTPVLNQVNLLTRLVEDLRTLALAEAGQLPLNKRPADLAALLRETLTSFESQAAAQQVTLRSEIAPDLPADRDRSRSDAADHRDFDLQRAAVYSTAGIDHGGGAIRSGECDDRGGRHRQRHRAGRSAPRVRSLLSRR